MLNYNTYLVEMVSQMLLILLRGLLLLIQQTDRPKIKLVQWTQIQRGLTVDAEL